MEKPPMDKPSILALKRAELLGKVSGAGIEIGAYHSPMKVDASVRYVDLFSREDAGTYYPEASEGRVVLQPDIIAAADDLPMLGDSSQDFVLNNGLMEHLADPIKALKEWHRILRPGGLLFLGLPDKRYSFDVDRQRTPLQHLIEDHRRQGSETRARDFEHYREWSRFVNGIAVRPQMEFWAELLQVTDYPVHFHCWIPEDIRNLFTWLAEEESLIFQIEGEAIVEESLEFAFLLRIEKP